MLKHTREPDNFPVACRLCPRECGGNRTAGQHGYCKAGSELRIYRHGPHFGEEPPLSGTHGSGTVFFSHCTLRCLYCQNHPWSQGGNGTPHSVADLTAILRQLARQGCHNWNLVSPTPWLPLIRAAARPLFSAGKRVPFVYNSSGFERLETLEEYSELADIALIDLRYATASSAAAGSDATTYVAAARKALQWFWNKLGPLKCDKAGIARRGVICRLLALPGRVDEAIANLAWLADNVGNDIHISVMSQYTPVYRAPMVPGWDRAVTETEYATLTEAVDDLGFESGWVQEFTGGTPADLLGQNMPAGEGVVGAGAVCPRADV